MKKINGKLAVAFILILAIALIASGCGGNDTKAAQSNAAGEKLKVAFVYVGPVSDAGWTTSHDQGRQYLEQQLDYVKTSKIESVKEGPDATRVIEQLVADGNKIIFTTSFGFMDPTIEVAKKHPDVKFLHCSGYKTADNVGTYFGRMYQARYLSGVVAGKMTKTNLIGYVAAYPIPEVIRGINAFTVGVRSVNPDAKVKVVWTSTWYDPATEKDAGKSLLESGCDIIAQHQDTPGPLQAAQEKGKYGIGYNTDMNKLVPNTVLTSPVWNWGPYYVETVKAIKEGTWKPSQYWGPINDGIVGLAPFGTMVPEDVKQLVEAEKQKLVKGEWDVFAGPVKDQQGKERVAAGQKMSDKEMLEFNWFVEGVEGSIPKN